MGIEYGDYFRYRSTSLVTYGHPINVTEFVKSLDVENEAQMMEPLRKELSEGIKGLITYIKDDENYAAKWELTKIRALGFKGGLHDRMMHNREIVADIEKEYEENPDKMQELFEKVAEFEKARRRKGVSIYSFGKKCLLLSAISKGILMLLGLPYFIFSAMVTLPMWGIFEFLVQSREGYVSDDAIRAAAKHFGVPVAEVEGVLTFYAQFKRTKPGKNKICICDGTACHIKGSTQVASWLEAELGIGDGQTTEDGIFSLETVACLGCCSLAPVMSINGKVYGKLDRKGLTKILNEYRKLG